MRYFHLYLKHISHIGLYLLSAAFKVSRFLMILLGSFPSLNLSCGRNKVKNFEYWVQLEQIKSRGVFMTSTQNWDPLTLNPNRTHSPKSWCPFSPSCLRSDETSFQNVQFDKLRAFIIQKWTTLLVKSYGDFLRIYILVLELRIFSIVRYKHRHSKK